MCALAIVSFAALAIWGIVLERRERLATDQSPGDWGWVMAGKTPEDTMRQLIAAFNCVDVDAAMSLYHLETTFVPERVKSAREASRGRALPSPVGKSPDTLSRLHLCDDPTPSSTMPEQPEVRFVTAHPQQRAIPPPSPPRVTPWKDLP